MSKDDLAKVIQGELNKQFKHQKVAYFLEEGGNPTDVTGWISTGSTMLDIAISNKPNGGVAVGKITELNGLEGSGKSLIGSHLLASTQRKDGVAVYIDAESAVSPEFLTAIGVDTKTMLYVHLETVEEIFDYLNPMQKQTIQCPFLCNTGQFPYIHQLQTLGQIFVLVELSPKDFLYMIREISQCKLYQYLAFEI